jgi:hypothetical protein
MIIILRRTLVIIVRRTVPAVAGGTHCAAA